MSVELMKKRIWELQETLKPFANEAENWESASDEDDLVEPFTEVPDPTLKVKHLRDARRVLENDPLVLTENPNFGIF